MKFRLLFLTIAAAAPALAQGDKSMEVGKPNVNKTEDTVAKYNIERKEGDITRQYHMDIKIPKGEDWSAAKKAEMLVKALKDSYTDKKAPHRNRFAPSSTGAKITIKGGPGDNHVVKITKWEDTTGQTDKMKIKDGVIQLSYNDFDFSLPGTAVCSGTTSDPDGDPVAGSAISFGIEGLYVSSIAPVAGQSGESLLDAVHADLLSNAPSQLLSAMFYDDAADLLGFDFGSALTGAEAGNWSFVAGFNDLDAGAAMTWAWSPRGVVPAPAGLATLALAMLAATRRRR